MRCLLGVIVCVFMLFLAPIPSICGDMGAIIHLVKGGAVSPKFPHSTIRMDSQQVVIRLERDSYIVDAVFDFFNTGETTTEWVGFPEIITGEPNYPARPGFIRFEAWVNGKKIRVEQDIKGWLVHHVIFPAHARTTIRTSYEAYYSHSPEKLYAYYVFGTGELWKGQIGKTVFVVDSSDVGGVNNIEVNIPATPGQRLIGDNLVRFEIENAKPRHNDQISIEIGYIHARPRP